MGENKHNYGGWHTQYYIHTLNNLLTRKCPFYSIVKTFFKHMILVALTMSFSDIHSEYKQ